MKDKRSKVKIYTAAAKRLLMWHFLSSTLDLILVPEFVKSGGSWFCEMMADATGAPFPRNESPAFEQCIMHGHHLFHPRMGKAIAVVRDGRDIMVSAYFHFLFENDRNLPQEVNYHREEVCFKDYHDARENMPKFIEHMFTNFAKKNMFHFRWDEFIDSIYDYPKNVCKIKYEELLTQPVACLQKAIAFYNLSDPGRETLKHVVKKHSFENKTDRQEGSEKRKSFMRKGISGDWKNYFTEASCDVFKKYGGKALVKAGYEQDENWCAPE